MQFTSIKYLLVAVAMTTATSLANAKELTVSAAASLTNAFKDIASSYEAKNPDTRIMLNFGASGALLQQMTKGAPVDIFASADQETMDTAEQQGLISKKDRQNFVSNSLVLILPIDSKQPINQLEDLGHVSVQKIAIGNPASVPIGRYTRHALEAVKLWEPVSAKAIYTQSVRQALDYVARGEVDAGFVYATDAAIMKDKVKVAFNIPLNKVISYPIAKTTNSENAKEAGHFIEFVLSPDGQAILHKYGFEKP